jgi:hypothetical protein
MKNLIKKLETIPFKLKDLIIRFDNHLSKFECFKSSAERYGQNEIRQPQIKGKLVQTSYFPNGERKFYRNGVEL